MHSCSTSVWGIQPSNPRTSASHRQRSKRLHVYTTAPEIVSESPASPCALLLDLRATELTQEVELKATLGRIADKVSTNEPPDSSDWALLESNAYELSFEHGEFWTHGLARNADILECPQDQ